MSTKIKMNNSLMNNFQNNAPMNPNLLYMQYANQNNQLHNMNQLSLPFNSYTNNANYPFNNQKKYQMAKQTFFYGQNLMSNYQYYPKYFTRNESFVQNNYYPQKKYKNKKHVFNRYEKEALPERNKKNDYYPKRHRRDSINSYSTNCYSNSDNSNEEKTQNEKSETEQEKETLILLNNKEEKNEEEDYEINEDNIPNNRRFSQSSKRSNDSRESNCSNSTSDSTDEVPKDKPEKIEKDVSLPNEENKTKTEQKTEYKGNPAFENTVILNVKVKLGENKYAYFKLKRFDDIFVTIQYFCEINNLDEKMIKPLIIKSLCAINTIYQVMNSTIDDENKKVLEEIAKKS